MALKGTDVVKRLPDGGKKNCRECGFPTCFAFAMKLAAGGVSLDKCPYLPADVKVDEKLKKIKELQFPWVGLTLKANVLALRFESGDKAKFEALVKKVCEGTDLPMVLMSEDVDALLSARKMCGDRKPLLYPVP